MKKLIYSALASIITILPSITFAIGNFDDAGENLLDVGNKLGGGVKMNLGEVVGITIRTALGLVGLMFFILMIYAGYLWMTARGESEPVDKAKKIITAAIIGLVVVASAYAITILVTGAFDSSIGTTG